MRQRVSAILVVALLVSAGATYGIYRFLAIRASRSGGMPATQVVQAARTLEIGTLIKSSDLQTGFWVGAIPAGMATKKDALIGRGVVASIYSGEAVMETRLAPARAGA